MSHDHDQSHDQSHEPSPARSLVLNVDQNLQLLALQETCQLLAQLLELPDVRAHARLLARRALLRLAYFLRHSGHDQELDPAIYRALQSFQAHHQAEALDRCLDRLRDLQRSPHLKPE